MSHLLYLKVFTATALMMLSAPSDALVEVKREVFLMGTRCTLTAYASDGTGGLENLESFLRILEQSERELSTWRADSLFSQLNRQPPGVPLGLDRSLCRLLSDLFYWNRETGLAFDPGIGALIEVWGLREGGKVPSPESIETARKQAGLNYFRLDPNQCEITRTQNVWIDSGAFGKGEALDRVHRYASQIDSGPWMIDLGGQIMVSGSPPDEEGWEVGLAHPVRRGKSVLKLRLKEGSLAASGGSERDLAVHGARVGHILDPRTGRPAAFKGSVVVWHQQALVADILSTALFVMGPEEGLSWANSRQVAACFIFPSSDARCHEISASLSFSSLFPLTTDH
ncbi:MAG: FAD:protein FMN transferase [Acidobacteriota bacterium]